MIRVRGDGLEVRVIVVVRMIAIMRERDSEGDDMLAVMRMEGMEEIRYDGTTP